MRMTRSFLPSVRVAASSKEKEAAPPGFRLAEQGGFLRPFGAGIVQFFPLGARLLSRLVDAFETGLQELDSEPWIAPTACPEDRLEKAQLGADFLKNCVSFKDRSGRALRFGVGAEHAFFEAAASLVRSYKMLPIQVHGTRPQFQNLERSRPGLFDLRETKVLESLALVHGKIAAQERFDSMHQICLNILRTLKIAPLTGMSSPLSHGGQKARSIWAAHPAGQSQLCLCQGCGLVQESSVAVCAPPESKSPSPQEEPLQRVETPGCKTIPQVATFLNVPLEQTAKAVFFTAEDLQLVFAVVRGEDEVSEAKLAAAANVRALRPATEEEIRAVGAEPGYASPIGLPPEVRVFLDRRVAETPNLVAGANAPDMHYTGTCYPRDYQGVVADLAQVKEDQPCGSCGQKQKFVNAVELIQCTDLGDLPKQLGVEVQLADSQKVHPKAVHLEINLWALFGILAENRIQDGPPKPWPVQAAPYEVQLISLVKKDPEQLAEVERMYKKLKHFGFRVLFDDRSASPGQKFQEAELLGTPLWVVLGPKGLTSGVAEVRDPTRGTRKETQLTMVQERLDILREGLTAS